MYPKVSYDLYDNDQYYRLKIEGWMHIPVMATFLDIDRQDLISMALQYNVVIKNHLMLFKTLDDFSKMAQWIESIFIIKKLKGEY